MSGRIVTALNDKLGRFFPERRIYIRSDARTRYLTFAPTAQFGATVVFTALLGWSAFTTVAFISTAVDGRTAENRLEATKEAYEVQLAALRDQQRLLEEEINRSNQRGDVVTGELSVKQQLLVETAGRLRAADAELIGLRNRMEALLSERRVERDQINALNEEVTGLRLTLADAQRGDAELSDTLATFSTTMARVISERDHATGRAQQLDTQVATLQAEIGRWHDRQENLLAQLEAATGTSLAALDQLFVGTGVDLDGILDTARRDFTGRGGGPVDDAEEERQSYVTPLPEEETGRVSRLTTDIERMSLMRVAIDRLPFGMPTTSATRLTSPFGMRRDPFGRGRRMHNGVDFAGPIGTPIYATGEGVVTFSGRQRGYGIVVKIRHAFGFETVYAHLSKSRVSVGQRVARGDRIADMGNTGRSTGSHLHYEVRIDGTPVNPSKFMKAARDVL
ncbi:MAG: DUF5930 domain-containing protein [Pseudomonadota bacterium]